MDSLIYLLVLAAVVAACFRFVRRVREKRAHAEMARAFGHDWK
jgi:hypothetical protein